MTIHKPMTLRRKMSFMVRIDRISGNIKEFSSGQKYVEEKDWKQLRNMADVIDHGYADLASPSVHNLVRVGYVSLVRQAVEAVRV